MIRIKRAYEAPEESDGTRYLVDRLWPRGISKRELKIAAWFKDAAPSQDLRRWFHGERADWEEFRRRYFAELDANPQAWSDLLQAARKGRITLLYSARDTEHNNAVALAEYLNKRLKADQKRR